MQFCNFGPWMEVYKSPRCVLFDQIIFLHSIPTFGTSSGACVRLSPWTSPHLGAAALPTMWVQRTLLGNAHKSPTTWVQSVRAGKRTQIAHATGNAHNCPPARVEDHRIWVQEVNTVRCTRLGAGSDHIWVQNKGQRCGPPHVGAGNDHIWVQNDHSVVHHIFGCKKCPQLRCTQRQRCTFYLIGPWIDIAKHAHRDPGRRMREYFPHSVLFDHV